MIMSGVRPELVIIGAGASGIAAATKLIENGLLNVKILEAENKIGGRLHSVEFGGSFVDLGGTWVHGEDGNVVYEKVKNLDVLSPSEASNYSDLSFYISDGKKVDKSLSEKIWSIGMEIIENEKAAKEYGGKFGEYVSDAFNRKLSEVAASDNQTSTVAKLILEWFKKFVLCLDPAESWNEMSVNGPYYFKKCEGNQLLNWRDKGYASILDILINDISDVEKQKRLRENIFLNKNVNEIVWDKQGKVEIKCSDGSIYSADHVIVTVSIGALKLIKHIFSPELPERKAKAIDDIPLGTTNKILLKFPAKWWPDDVKDFSFLWTEEDKRNLVKDFPYGPVVDGRSWLEDVFGFYTVDSHSKVLLGWMVGPMAREVELLSDDIVQQGVMFLLRKFVGNHYNIPEPDGILRSKWGTNPHFNGAYSYVNIDMEKNPDARVDIIKPLDVNGKPVVLFAGEATHPTFFSSAHGAIETGYREADRLLDLYKKAEYHRIVIVGAGMAGLGAAREFQSNGLEDFIILEAQDKPGGRIDTIYIDNKPLDLGAQWLHGKDNPLYDLARNHNLICDEMSEEGLGLYVRSNGQVADEFIVKHTDFKIGQILDECGKLLDSPTHSPSLDDFLNQKFCEYVLNSDNDNNDIKQELYDWHKRFQVIDNSCIDLKRLSAKKWGEYICLDDTAHFNLKFGYKALVDILVDDLERNCIRFNSEVTRIELRDDNKVQLFVKDNKLFICDHLILTASLGVLKQFNDLPHIFPKYTIDSIASLGFHGISKIYLFFDEKWWHNDGFQLLWTKDCDFDEKETWLRHITGFDEVLNHPKALMTWVGGEAVREVENLEEEEIGRQCVTLLRKFLKYLHRVPSPVKVIRTRWLANPYVKGSYCHITPECDEIDAIRQLNEPLLIDHVPRILLAGEAIHPSHYSTTHGAFESGQQQAQRLTNFINGSRIHKT